MGYRTPSSRTSDAGEVSLRSSSMQSSIAARGVKSKHETKEGLEDNRRYIQIAFNNTIHQFYSLIRNIPRDPHIIIEAGTPFIKREGIDGVRAMRRQWRGVIVADLKVTDGAKQEVLFAREAGATAVTAIGTAPVETLDVFNRTCKATGLYSMIDMLGQDEPLKKLMALSTRPDVVVIHKGRDEEANPRSIIRYKDINKIRSKFGLMISVAGGLEPTRIKNAYFNGADIAILNIIFDPEDLTHGLQQNADFRSLIPVMLDAVK